MGQLKGRPGKHIKKQPPNSTTQTKIKTDPQLPCKKECGRLASPSRTDGMCANCGHFQDRSHKH